MSIAVLENVPPDAGLQKRATFSTLNVGLAVSGNRTWDTCVASSGTNRSAIHYAFIPVGLLSGNKTKLYIWNNLSSGIIYLLQVASLLWQRNINS
jgi:hypothetical protein